jgi:hypothetical protein
MAGLPLDPALEVNYSFPISYEEMHSTAYTHRAQHGEVNQKMKLQVCNHGRLWHVTW